MTDIILLPVGGDPEKVKASERARFRDETIVDQIIEIDNKWRKSKKHSAISNKTMYSEVRGRQLEEGARSHIKGCCPKDEGVKGSGQV